MSQLPRIALLGCIPSVCFLSSCGISTPKLQDIVERRPTPEIYDSIFTKVSCEVGSAIQMAVLQDKEYADQAKGHPQLPQGRQLAYMDKWIADVTLTMTVDEKSGFNPGLTLNAPIQSESTVFRNKTTLTTAQSFNFGLGANLSSQATRRDTFEWLINFADFTDDAHLALAAQEKAAIMATKHEISDDVVPGCNGPSGFHVEGNLQIRDWLYGLLPQAYDHPTDEAPAKLTPYQNFLEQASKAKKKDVFSHQITFVLVYGANATPSWKLFRVAANQGSTPLIMGQRTRTQDLQIVIGPTYEQENPPPAGAKPTEPRPSQRVQNAALVGQIQQALQTALKNTQ